MQYTSQYAIIVSQNAIDIIPMFRTVLKRFYYYIYTAYQSQSQHRTTIHSLLAVEQLKKATAERSSQAEERSDKRRKLYHAKGATNTPPLDKFSLYVI